MASISAVERDESVLSTVDQSRQGFDDEGISGGTDLVRARVLAFFCGRSSDCEGGGTTLSVGISELKRFFRRFAGDEMGARGPVAFGAELLEAGPSFARSPSDAGGASFLFARGCVDWERGGVGAADMGVGRAEDFDADGTGIAG